MKNKSLIVIMILLLIIFVPNVLSEVTKITSSSQNSDQQMSQELLISSTIKKEFNNVYTTIQTDMMTEIDNVGQYVDDRVEQAYSKLSVFYLKVMLTLVLVNLISIIFAQFIIFKIRAKELDYLRMFTQTQNNTNVPTKKQSVDTQINDISDDLNKLNKDILKNTSVPKPVTKTDDIVSIDNI